jgi:hypothetical protein
MTTLSFGGVTLRCWQSPKKNLDRPYKKTGLFAGTNHVSRSANVIKFPIEFQCYTENQTEMDAVDALILADYGTLTIDSVDHTNCFVFNISGGEVSLGSGKWKYTISFDKADVH